MNRSIYQATTPYVKAKELTIPKLRAYHREAQSQKAAKANPFIARPNVLKRIPALSKLSFSIPILLSIIVWAAPAIAQEKVEKIKDDASETVWSIKQPEVKTARRDYRTVTFKKYDEVVVTGGGCVQTGGKGRTWKRYIDPSGTNSDRLYHGRIWIPGATDGLVRISSIEKVRLVVNKFPDHPAGAEEPSPYFLRLGYEDDKFKDNGYDKHDGGTDNQCVLKEDPDTDGNAWLEVRIIHHDGPSSAPRTLDPKAPFDLWWDRVDDNFLPLNPDWWVHQSKGIFPNSNKNDANQGCNQFREGKGDQLLVAKDPRCTTWDPDVDEANALSSFCHLARPFANSVHGHINWGPVTFTGKVYFDVSNNLHLINPLTGNPGDGDYDWFLAPKDNLGKLGKVIDNGFAEGNLISCRRAIQDDKLPAGVNALALEFSSRETVDRIKDSSWWKDFHYNVDHKPDEAIRMVKGKDAIVIGLIGFDNEHGDRDEGARVELHPVYGMAIHTQNTDDDPALLEDVWVILARNWGNQGSCSNGWDLTRSKWLHYLGLHENRMKFFLPAKMGPSTIVTAKLNTAKFKTQSLSDGVLLTIQLSEPEKKELFWGELRIKK